MKIKITGIKYWGNIKTYLHTSLQDFPTPFDAHDINGNKLYSQIGSSIILKEAKKVRLKKGDYVMLIANRERVKYGDTACGHMHYFDGNNLISVYTKEKWVEE